MQDKEIEAILKYRNILKKDIYTNIEIYKWKEIYNIQNKPLNLYTPQEEKDLLELLLKLKD